MRKFFPRFNEKYVYHTFRAYHPLLCIYDAGITYPDERYHSPERAMRENLFEYIVSGKGYIIHEGKKHTVSAGDCVFVRKGETVEYFTDRDELYTKLWFTTDGSFTPKMLEAFGVQTGFCIIKKNLYRMFEVFLRDLEKEGFSMEKSSAHVLKIMLAMFVTENEENSANLSLADQIKFYIDSLWQSGIDINDIAERFGISARTCMRHFSKAFGKTPHAYIKMCKLESSKELLSGTDYSISEISRLCLFCDQSYFSTEFFKQYGLYPSEYRKQIRKQFPCFPQKGNNY